MKVAILGLLSGPLLFSADWPQWMGPDRDGVWTEDGIVESFPEGGPKILWRVPVEDGYSSPAISGGHVYVTDFKIDEGEIINNPGKAISLEGTERVLCLDIKDGSEVWTHEVKRSYEVSYPGGPRCTPTVADGKVYVVGAMGHLDCLDAKTGDVIWQKNLPEEFGGKIPIWGHSAHPLVHGGLIYVLAGGKDSLVVALDKDTGDKKWGALNGTEIGYSPPSIIEHGGVEQLIIWTPQAIHSLNPKDGAEYWSKPLKPNYNMSIMIPRKSGNRLFASGIGRVGALLELNDDKPDAKFLWKGKPNNAVYSANSTPLIVEDTLYGVDVESSGLIAVNLEDGERLWETSLPATGEEEARFRHGTAFLTRHKPSGLFFLNNEIGELIIAKLSPEGYQGISTAKILEPTNEAFGRKVVWSAASFAQKSAFIRNDKEIVRVDLAK